MVVMLFKTNILGLVGSDNNKEYKRCHVVIWDDYQQKSLSELKFSQNVLNLKLRKDKIIVVCLDKIYLFDLKTFKNLDIIETGENPNGCIGISYAIETTKIAYPDKIKGKIKIKYYEKSKIITIDAHLKTLGNIVMLFNGDLIASATECGTIIRVFDTENGNLLKEVRRGKDKASISCITFSKDYNFLMASSNRGTVHVWSLETTIKNFRKNSKDNISDSKNEEENIDNENIVKSRGKTIANRKSILRVLPNALGGEYFGSEKSFAQVRINKEKSICTFGEDNTIIIVCLNGKYYKAQMDLDKGGECKIIEEKEFMVK